MAINKNVFIHPADKAALKALKAIPGFTQILRAFMRFWSEENLKIENMATKVKLSENQLPQYYNLLPPICEKLGIEVPELYLEFHWEPNAYTFGDTKPSITITSALLELIPEELLPTVLAHECGHIACHHSLYTTMGALLINGALTGFSNIAETIMTPVKSAFAYWMRCSEFSADRAAILCDGTPDKTFELCMRVAGFDKDIIHDANLDAFFEQAKEYRKLVNKNALNKAREIRSFYFTKKPTDHPVHSVRALEAFEWANSDDFIKSKEYFAAAKREEKPLEFPISFNEKHFLGRKVEDVEEELFKLGFEDVDLIRNVEKALFSKNGSVTNVNIKGSDKYKDGDWVSVDSKVDVTYYLPLTDDEIAAMHPGEIKLPSTLKSYVGKSYEEVNEQLRDLGFENIIIDEIKDITKEKDKNLGKIASITIDKNPKCTKGDWISEDALIEITYHSK